MLGISSGVDVAIAMGFIYENSMVHGVIFISENIWIHDFY